MIRRLRVPLYRRVALMVAVYLPLLATDTVASEGLPLGLKVEGGGVHSGGGINDTSPVYALALEYRVTKHIGWRVRGGIVEFERGDSGVAERFLQLNLNYYFPDSKYFMKGPYLTAGYGLHKVKSRGPVADENDDGARSGANVGAGYQVPLVEDEYLSFVVEGLYNAVSQVNPANFVSVTAGIKWGF